MLTDTEIKKLQEDHGKKSRDKANDFIVRRKFKRWLAGLFVVAVYIVPKLPQRQLKKMITKDHIKHLIFILDLFLSIWGVVPLKHDIHGALVILPNRPPREATGEEALITGWLKHFIHNLFQHLSPEDVRDVMQWEINHYHPGYALTKREVEGPLSMDKLLESELLKAMETAQRLGDYGTTEEERKQIAELKERVAKQQLESKEEPPK